MLKVCEARHYHLDIRFSQIHNAFLHILYEFKDIPYLVPKEKPEVQSNLVIAAPRSMQFARRLTYLPAQTFLNGKMDVFISRLKPELSRSMSYPASLLSNAIEAVKSSTTELTFSLNAPPQSF
jgi:hypothetical protein